jgi:predicted ATPase/DNA-binding winged helix-turn-helix (wHTH) protein
MTTSALALRQSAGRAAEPPPNPRALTGADRISGSATGAISFGPFRLLPTQRLLLEGNEPLHLGSRALDILIALVERPGELVSKDELMARVWPNTFVEPANLTVHIAALRRTLGDGRDGNRFLLNIPGRGYRFVAPVAFADDLRPPEAAAVAIKPAHNLPTRLTRLIGRADIVNQLTERLPQSRLLTIAGPGGIGKTSVAIAVAERLIEAYEHGVRLVDLAPVRDPLLVPSALAAALGLELHSEEPLAELVAAVSDKRILLVLDNCAHIVGACAEVVVSVLRRAAGVHILATSREPLRVDGEHVHRLSPLESPPASASVTAAEALAFPAVQLFVERAAASSNDFALDDGDAPVAAEICRRLDGVPLAIELAAARVGTIGVRGVAAHLEEDRLGPLTDRRRTTSARQQTMRATFDWSYGLLTELEQAILRRLSVFAGSFTLRAAATVAADRAHSECEIIDNVLNLVAKSLIMTDTNCSEPRLWLFETARAYGLEKLAESGERDTIYHRHSECCRAFEAEADNAKASRRSSRVKILPPQSIIEPDVQISRIRLSDKISRLCLTCDAICSSRAFRFEKLHSPAGA